MKVLYFRIFSPIFRMANKIQLWQLTVKCIFLWIWPPLENTCLLESQTQNIASSLPPLCRTTYMTFQKAHFVHTQRDVSLKGGRKQTCESYIWRAASYSPCGGVERSTWITSDWLRQVTLTDCVAQAQTLINHNTINCKFQTNSGERISWIEVQQQCYCQVFAWLRNY